MMTDLSDRMEINRLHQIADNRLVTIANLCGAIDDIVANWQSGDLAGAVNVAEATADAARENYPELESVE